MSIARDPLALGPELGGEPTAGTDLPSTSGIPSQPSVGAPGAGGVSPSVPTATEHPPVPPQLAHTYSAPTTLPPSTAVDHPTPRLTSGTHANGPHDGESESESPTPTLYGLNGAPVAHAAGAQPAPGTEVYGLREKDHQAGTVGGKTGEEVAALAAAELGIDAEKAGYHGELGEGAEEKQPHASQLDKTLRLDRTASGTKRAHNVHTGTGANTVEGRGMVHITRQMSQPPNVSPFGGVAPAGTDAERGLRAVRSREEEEERDVELEQKGPDPWVVTFEPGESANPKNWGVGYRWFLTSLAGLLVLNSTFASSSPSGIVEDMMAYFGFSQEVAVLTISLFVAGYCVGPILWGPLSESYGRRPIFLITFVFYTGFQVGCALSKNTASILIFRFLGGIFASAPLTNSGALLADIWEGDHRGQAMSLFSLAPFAGPSIGPIVSGFIQVSGTSWRWVYWILTIFAGFCFLAILFFIPETYAPKLLAKKAKRLRKDTGESRWYAPLERADRTLKARLNDIVLKPFIIIALEPMLQAVTLYMSFVYGVVYLLFEAYPFVFVRNHGFNSGEEGLAFLGFFFGGVLAVIVFVTVIEPRFQRHAKAVAPSPPEPERRLELCVVSGISLVVAMFWFGWTSYSSIHWISPVLAGGLIGVATLGMFVSLFNYIIDVYLWSAASALAVATVFRSLFGAGFPLFATQMFEKLGTQWASSLLGFIALALAPIPIVLMKYGKHLRARSKYSPNKA